MKLGIIVERTAAQLLAPMRDRPRYHVAIGIMIEMQVQGHRVIQTDIFGIEDLTLDHASGEGDDASVLTPHEKANLVRHPRPEAAKICFRQFLEMQFRAVIDVEVKWVHLIDKRRYVPDHGHL